MHVLPHTRTHARAHIHVCTWAHNTYKYKHMRIQIYTHTNMWTYISTSTHAHIHIGTHIYTCTRRYVHCTRIRCTHTHVTQTYTHAHTHVLAHVHAGTPGRPEHPESLSLGPGSKGTRPPFCRQQRVRDPTAHRCLRPHLPFHLDSSRVLLPPSREQHGATHTNLHTSHIPKGTPTPSCPLTCSSQSVHLANTRWSFQVQLRPHLLCWSLQGEAADSLTGNRGLGIVILGTLAPRPGCPLQRHWSLKAPSGKVQLPHHGLRAQGMGQPLPRLVCQRWQRPPLTSLMPLSYPTCS